MQRSRRALGVAGRALGSSTTFPPSAHMKASVYPAAAHKADVNVKLSELVHYKEQTTFKFLSAQVKKTSCDDPLNNLFLRWCSSQCNVSRLKILAGRHLTDIAGNAALSQVKELVDRIVAEAEERLHAVRSVRAANIRGPLFSDSF